MTDSRYNIIVIGGGAVGLGVALEITRRFPRQRLLVLEKEDRVARHQSGHNSGVIHSGVYYKPGSLKARLCVAGAAAMVEFCREHGIPHQVCGKVIVASQEEEIPRLEDLRQRGEANGLAGLRVIGPEELREIEPHAAGLKALLVPSTGVTDYALVCAKYAELIAGNGAVLTSSAATGIKRSASEIVIETPRGAFATDALINCAGLYSDRISRMAGDDPGVMIVPFRGEYYDLVPERALLVRALIYPVPDPRFPFLGVHFTRRITGKVDAGPNAVLALAREGYRHMDINVRDLTSALAFPGFWRMARQHWRNGFGEWYRSVSKAAFVRALQRLLPEIGASDLTPGGSGVRAQALKPDGALVDDFQFVPSGKVLHVLNVPSPAATASLTIGKAIVDMAAKNLGLN
ncbi:MAG: L-2-hydroxyglutarate oxidase [Candidatus Sulfotelmatobacter sp.]